MKKMIAMLMLTFCLYSNSYAQGRQHKVVLQFTNATDTMQQKAILKQLQNLQEHWPDASYEVVVYNQGLELLMPGKSVNIPLVQKLIGQGVRFVVCENSMKNRKIGKEAFIPEAGFVKAGIAELVEKQEDGWIYIKGGF